MRVGGIRFISSVIFIDMKNLLLALLIFPLTVLAQYPQKIDSNNQIIEHDGFVLSYNETCEQPNWVYYVSKPSDFRGEKIKRTNNFRGDKLVPTRSAQLSDYKGSGYDRGHLKPAGDEPTNRKQMSETFVMSNMSPQAPSFNRGIWKKLESYVRNKTINSDSLIVITGGVLNDSLPRIGKNGVCIPKYYYKVIYIFNKGETKLECFLLPNKKSTLDVSAYRIKIKELEGKIGLKF